MDADELRRIFQMFDHNGDGRITQKELSESLEKLGIFIPENELTLMIEKIDVNCDGCVDIVSLLDDFSENRGTTVRRRSPDLAGAPFAAVIQIWLGLRSPPFSRSAGVPFAVDLQDGSAEMEREGQECREGEGGTKKKQVKNKILWESFCSKFGGL